MRLRLFAKKAMNRSGAALIIQGSVANKARRSFMPTYNMRCHLRDKIHHAIVVLMHRLSLAMHA